MNLPALGRLLLAVSMWLSATAAVAGGIAVMPTRVQFASGQGVQSVLLTNHGTQTVTIETHVMVWPEGAVGQRDGDVIVSPAVVTIAPTERVRVRVGLLRRGTGEAEAAYRLYFTELPSPTRRLQDGIGVRMQIGIPVFVAPDRAQAQPLHWSVHDTAGGRTLVVHNDGNVHKRLNSAQLEGAPSALLPPTPYVLARSSLAIPLPPGLAAAGARVRWSEGDDVREGTVVARP